MRPKRRSGLSVPYVSIASRYVNTVNGSANLNAAGLEKDSTNEVLGDVANICRIDEGHLQIDLCELRLTIRPEILVPKALHDLNVPIEPGGHQKLLVRLWRLRQRIELPRLDAAWHEVIPGALRSALHQDGGFDLDKPELLKISMDGLIDGVSKQEIALQRRTTEVKKTVTQADVLVRLDVIFNGEWRSVSPAE